MPTVPWALSGRICSLRANNLLTAIRYIVQMAEKQKISGEFGTVLRSYRLEKGMTQEHLGLLVEAVRSHICMLESGKKQPSLTMIFRLAAALGIKPGELMDAVAERLEK